MTGTDKPSEESPQILEAVPSPPAPEQAAFPERRLLWPQPKTIRHVVIEVLIVAIGVLLALGTHQMRQHFTRLAQAEETRQLLKEEVRRNLQFVEQGMHALSSVYGMIEDEPEQAPSLFRMAGRGTPLLIDVAYEVARETGAFFYLRSEERSEIATAYRSMEIYELNRREFGDAYKRLAVYPSGALTDSGRSSARSDQTRFVQIQAGVIFGFECRMAVRFRIMLNEPTTDKSPVEYCSGIELPTDVEALIAGRYTPPATSDPPQTETSNSADRT